MATRNSSARSSSTPSARAGSSRTSASAVLSVLNRKCGRMRDCSSARRAVVSAGSGGLARAGAATRTSSPRSPRRRAPGRSRSAPTSPAPEASTSRAATSVEVSQAATAPKPIAASHCSAHRRRARAARFSAQTTSSQISTPGRATLEPAAVSAEPDRERRRGEDHADRHHAVHEQQRAQDDADVADVERRIRAAPARRRDIGRRCRSWSRRSRSSATALHRR